MHRGPPRQQHPFSNNRRPAVNSRGEDRRQPSHAACDTGKRCSSQQMEGRNVQQQPLIKDLTKMAPPKVSNSGHNTHTHNNGLLCQSYHHYLCRRSPFPQDNPSAPLLPRISPTLLTLGPALVPSYLRLGTALQPQLVAQQHHFSVAQKGIREENRKGISRGRR